MIRKPSIFLTNQVRTSVRGPLWLKIALIYSTLRYPEIVLLCEYLVMPLHLSLTQWPTNTPLHYKAAIHYLGVYSYSYTTQYITLIPMGKHQTTVLNNHQNQPPSITSFGYTGITQLNLFYLHKHCVKLRRISFRFFLWNAQRTDDSEFKLLYLACFF